MICMRDSTFDCGNALAYNPQYPRCRGSGPGDVASFQSFQRRQTPLRRSRKLLGRNSPTTNINGWSRHTGWISV